MNLRRLIVTLFILPVLTRGATIPKDVFSLQQYDQALKLAKEKKKPLAVVLYADDDSDEIMRETFKSVAGIAVTMALTSGDQGKNIFALSPQLVTAIVPAEGGQMHTPAIVLCSPAEDVVWKKMAISSQNLKLAKESLASGTAEAKPAITAYFASKTAPAIVPPGDKSLYWPLLEGVPLIGAFDKVENNQLFLKEASNTAGPVELNKLSPATLRYVKTIAAPGAIIESTAGKPAVEKWTNSKGKEIEATFVKLSEGRVTLRLTTGKEYTLALRDLSVASQARAEQLADLLSK